MNYSRFKNFTFFAALAAVSITFIYLLRPFLYPILWAAIIAGMFYPLYKKINSKIKHANLSSLSTILIILIIIVIPVVIITSLLFKEFFDFYTYLATNQDSILNTGKNLISQIQNNPITDKLKIDPQAITDRLTEITTVVTNVIFVTARNITQNSVTFLVLFLLMFFLMLYTLFFFLKDGEKILRRLAHLSPLGEKYEEMMYAKFTSTARAVLKGTMVIGIMQGSLTGITFYLVGIQGALVWGIITTFFSIIPGFGSYIVWLPAVLIMFATGNIWQGLVIIGAGLFISTIDNVVRPALVGKDAQMHPLLILFSTLGGLLMFGISGFIVGPITAALFLSLWEMYEQYYRQELDDDIEK